MVKQVTRRKFFWEYGQIQKEVKLILAVKSTRNKKAASRVAYSGIRKLLTFLPCMGKDDKENGAVALCAFASWVGGDIVPEVLETMNVVFGGTFPEKALEYINKLEHIQRARALKASFLERLTSTRTEVGRLLSNGQSTEAKVLAVSVIRELLPELQKMSKHIRQKCDRQLLHFARWQGMEIFTEVEEEVERLYGGNMPQNMTKRIANLKDSLTNK